MILAWASPFKYREECISFVPRHTSGKIFIQILAIRIVIRILDPDRNSDRQNLTDLPLARDTPVVKAPCKSVTFQVILRTDKQTNQHDQQHNPPSVG